MLYFLDSNIVIDLIDGNQLVAERLKNVYKHHTVRMSDIVYYEVLRGFKWKNAPKKLAIFERFFQKIPIEYQTIDSLRIAAENYAYLRAEGKTIEDDDILIGSLAIAKDAILVTNNTEHLSRLQRIRLEEWK